MPIGDKDDCKIWNKLDQIHKWAHICLDDLDPDDLHAAHRLGMKILQMLNDGELVSNGIKFIAVFEALAVGADQLNADVEELKHPRIIQ